MKLFVGAKGLVMFHGKLLLLRESGAYADGTEAGRWDMPGGRIEPEETLHEGLVREVREESGLTVAPRALLDVFDGFPEIGGERCHVVRIYYACEASHDGIELSGDHDAYAWVTPEEALGYELVDDLREIIHSSTPMGGKGTT